MTAAMLKTFADARPIFGKLTITKPSHATLRRIETVLTVTLAAQMVGLVIRFAL
jgi:hypothetical protein